MKNLICKLAIYTSLGFVTVSTSAQVAMDNASRDLLINKLSQVQKGLAPNDSSRVSVSLRLADLYAERARLASMQELADGCTECKAGKQDRESALRLYKEVLDRVPAASQGKVMIQMGHLYELTGQEVAAKDFYKKTAEVVPDPQAKAEAYLSLAEMLFKKNQFAEARGYYQEVLKVPAAQSRGLAAYRSAWCSFHLGNAVQASLELENILQTPSLLSKSGLAQGQVDPQFQEEVSRDLATFLAKVNFDKKQMESLYSLSPEKAKNANLLILAHEAEQAGKKQEALMVWDFAYQNQKDPSDRIESQLHKAVLSAELGQKETANKEFSAVSDQWQSQNGCGKSDCQELQKIWRQAIVVWNQAEKKSPSLELSQSYSIYQKVFPNDVQMILWGAQVASEQKQFSLAFVRQWSALQNMKQNKVEAKDFESAMLTAIEYAEANTTQPEVLVKAQDFYLQNTSLATRAFEVRYQKARALYEKNQMAQASEELKTLANDKKGSANLRIQAANLALDALSILKDEDKLILWSKEFAKEFPSNKTEFSSIEQKTILNHSANLAASGKQDQAMLVLASFDVAKASPQDRILYYKNKLILAQKNKDITVARTAAEDLLKIKELSAEDREFALQQKVWLAEMQLDFAAAYEATSQMSFKGQAPEVKTLKLALYADLSGKNALPLYQQYLKTSADQEVKAAVATEIVRRSPDPLKDIQSQKNILDKSPDLLARLYSEAYSKSPTEKILKTATADLKIQKTNFGRLLARVAFLKNFNIDKDKISKMNLDTKNQKTLARTIKDRGFALSKIEKSANQAIEMGDWTSQLVTIQTVAKESDRFYQELMGLPMPDGLKPEEENEYMQILSQQAAPFKAKADQTSAKAKEFWQATNWKSDLEKSTQEGIEFKGLVKEELTSLASVAENTDRDFINSLLNKNTNISDRPSLQEIESARNLVRSQPLNQGAVENLLRLEKKSQNFAMVQYLEGRLKAMASADFKNTDANKAGEKSEK